MQERGNKRIVTYRNVRLECSNMKHYSPVVSTDLCFWKTIDGDPDEENIWARKVERSKFFNHQPELYPFSLIVHDTVVDKAAICLRKKNGKPVFQCFNITTRARDLQPLAKEKPFNFFNRLFELHKPILMAFVDEILDIEGCPHIVKSKSDTGNA